MFASYDTYHPFPKGQYQFYCTSKDSLLLTKMYTSMILLLGFCPKFQCVLPRTRLNHGWLFLDEVDLRPIKNTLNNLLVPFILAWSIQITTSTVKKVKPQEKVLQGK